MLGKTEVVKPKSWVERRREAMFGGRCDKCGQTTQRGFFRIDGKLWVALGYCGCASGLLPAGAEPITGGDYGGIVVTREAPENHPLLCCSTCGDRAINLLEWIESRDWWAPSGGKCGCSRMMAQG